MAPGRDWTGTAPGMNFEGKPADACVPHVPMQYHILGPAAPGADPLPGRLQRLFQLRRGGRADPSAVRYCSTPAPVIRSSLRPSVRLRASCSSICRTTLRSGK